MKNLLLFVSIAVSSSLGPYYFLKIHSPVGCSSPFRLFPHQADSSLPSNCSGSGLLVLSPSYLLKQVKCRLSALGFKVLCNVTPNPFPPPSLTPPWVYVTIAHVFCLLRCFHALSFPVFRCRPLRSVEMGSCRTHLIYS